MKVKPADMKTVILTEKQVRNLVIDACIVAAGAKLYVPAQYKRSHQAADRILKKFVHAR